MPYAGRESQARKNGSVGQKKQNEERRRDPLHWEEIATASPNLGKILMGATGRLVEEERVDDSGAKRGGPTHIKKRRNDKDANRGNRGRKSGRREFGVKKKRHGS